VSESLLCNVNWSIFQLYRGKNKLHFNVMMMMSASYMLSWICIVSSSHWNVTCSCHDIAEILINWRYTINTRSLNRGWLYFYFYFSLKNKSFGNISWRLDMSLHSKTLYPDSEPTCLYSCSLKLHTLRETTNINIRAFDLTYPGKEPHDLPSKIKFFFSRFFLQGSHIFNSGHS
jgi:hypothetical protein